MNIQSQHPRREEYQQGPMSESPQFEIPIQPSIPSEVTEPPMNPMNITYTDLVSDVTEVPDTKVQVPVETLRTFSLRKENSTTFSELQT